LLDDDDVGSGSVFNSSMLDNKPPRSQGLLFGFSTDGQRLLHVDHLDGLIETAGFKPSQEDARPD